jgi:DNA-binding response OmpR family regulator
MTEPIRVLIVDDEPIVRATLKLASKKRQWRVVAVESAEEALESLRQDTFDVALIDKNLPEMSGVDLIREIRKTDKKLGIIMITGFASVDSAMETLHLGIDSYFEKPFDDIYAVIKRVEKVAADRKGSQRDKKYAAALEHFRNANQALRRSKEASQRVSKAIQAFPVYMDANEILKIMLVSSSDSDREWMVKQFGDSTKVVTASSSKEAIALARNKEPDLLIVDVSENDPNALESLKKLKTYTPQAGLIVLTAKRPPLSVVTQLIELGVRVILEKPLDATTFQKKLEFVARDMGCFGAAPIQWSKRTS